MSFSENFETAKNLAMEAAQTAAAKAKAGVVRRERWSIKGRSLGNLAFSAFRWVESQRRCTMISSAS